MKVICPERDICYKYHGEHSIILRICKHNEPHEMLSVCKSPCFTVDGVKKGYCVSCEGNEEDIE